MLPIYHSQARSGVLTATGLMRRPCALAGIRTGRLFVIHRELTISRYRHKSLIHLFMVDIIS